MVQELVDREEASANSDVDPIVVDSHVDSFCTELVNALAFSHEHYLQLLALGVVVDVLCEFLVDLIVLDGDVDCDTRLQVDNVGFECINFTFTVLQLLEQFVGCLVLLVNTRFLLYYVVACSIKICHDLRFGFKLMLVSDK